jgi:hypothetical protein
MADTLATWLFALEQKFRYVAVNQASTRERLGGDLAALEAAQVAGKHVARTQALERYDFQEHAPRAPVTRPFGDQPCSDAS